MKLYKINNGTAKKVLKYIEGFLKPVYNKKSMLSLESYANCREQGFSIINYTNAKRVSFSEHRNTHNIVVYAGMDKDFERNSNIPLGTIYNDREFYPNTPDGVNDAAQNIVDYLIKD